jgi:hypothetical protein
MNDPCEPHHYHGPARILGRIHRHRTRHIAAQLRSHPGACATGAKLSLTSTLLKFGIPAAGFIALAAIAPTLISAGTRGDVASDTADLNQDVAGGVAGGIGVSGGFPVAGSLGGNAGPGGTRHHPHPAPITEPPTWALLLLAAASLAGFRRWVRPG